jgi:hypothetical protein
MILILHSIMASLVGLLLSTPQVQLQVTDKFVFVVHAVLLMFGLVQVCPVTPVATHE